MVKHKRWSDKPPDTSEKKSDSEIVEEFSQEKPTRTLKSIISSGTKYALILSAAALLSGIFTPLTLGVEVEQVVYGMLILFIGLAGGIMIYMGIQNQKFTIILVCGGIGLMFASLVLIHELARRSLFT